MAENYMKDGAVENEKYCMPSGYASLTRTMNSESMYPSWNARADKQTDYPNETMHGDKKRMQMMGGSKLKSGRS